MHPVALLRTMVRLRRATLIHWNAAEGAERLPILQKAGYQSVCVTPVNGNHLHPIRDDPPEVIVIDLTRLPSLGREVGLALRRYRSTRTVPLVFAGGTPEKVERVRKELPDALFTSWEEIGQVLRRTPGAQVSSSTKPKPALAGYSGTPLAKKLGIKPGSSLLLMHAPEDFIEGLELPENVRVHRYPHAAWRVILFVRSAMHLRDEFAVAGEFTAEGGGLWIAWPKKTSGIVTDLSEGIIRQHGISEGWVDYKVCAIDPIWSGLLFARRATR